jgi:hypothetical protein
MKKSMQREGRGRVGGDTGGGKGRQLQGGQPRGNEAGRGSSMQGEHQDARGGGAGANQGGASRGASRMEPSHAHDRIKRDKPGKGRGK